MAEYYGNCYLEVNSSGSSKELWYCLAVGRIGRVMPNFTYFFLVYYLGNEGICAIYFVYNSVKWVSAWASSFSEITMTDCN